ncbi:unnamed protein product [Timema podura]|uniref:Uncharacterized protein n=1 Tax=Timema podura TaxID=61482 RepID=A0ABN7NRK5_TIMPD|nr:unnamed protein product [Timema podura]
MSLSQRDNESFRRVTGDFLVLRNDTIQPIEEIDKSTTMQVEEVTTDSIVETSTIDEMAQTPSSDMETYESENSTLYLEGPDDLPRSKRVVTGELSVPNLGISTHLTMPKSAVNSQTSPSNFEGSTQLSSPNEHNQNQRSLDIFDIPFTQSTGTITEKLYELSTFNLDNSSQLELPKIVAGSKLSSPNTDGSGRLSRPKANANVRILTSSLRDPSHGTPQGGILEATTLAFTLNDPNVIMTLIMENKSSTFENLEQMTTPQTMTSSLLQSVSYATGKLF